ncbi:unnamed protein product [Linum tenue]|uniref:U-box domain-containing protein n=2 Tax=Linum tenue TaxID=586396 RepID=A0AAV0I377_9ROSI|nr:unnamed protein product [Linum tenue]
MKDPVTAITGITYDRDSIEHWIFTGRNTTCPVTKQPLPAGSDLTPNHTLRRLIQSWCTCRGIDRIPTPKPLLDRFHVIKLLRRLPSDRLLVLRRLETLASEHDRNRRHLLDAGVPQAMVGILLDSFDRREPHAPGLHEAVRVLHLVRAGPVEMKLTLQQHHHIDRIVQALTWLLEFSNNHVSYNAVSVMRLLFEETCSSSSSNNNNTATERLSPDFFEKIVGFLRAARATAADRDDHDHHDHRDRQQAVNSALTVMLRVSPLGKNRVAMVESGAVFELVELELAAAGSLTESRRTTELVLGVLFNLCCCAEGRAEFLRHRAGVAVVAKRLMKASSPAADERAVMILSLVCKFSGTNAVLQELLSVKAVAKLCVVLQSDAAAHLKEKVAEILRLYSGEEWKSNPCMDTCLLSRYQYQS